MNMLRFNVSEAGREELEETFPGLLLNNMKRLPLGKHGPSGSRNYTVTLCSTSGLVSV